MSKPRIFLDSCVLVEGIVAPWSNARAVLVLCRASMFTLVLCEWVIAEVECALDLKQTAIYPDERLLKSDFDLLLKRLKVEIVPHSSIEEVRAASQWIRHRNDAPVLAAAVKAKPHWLITDNTAHFDADVAKATNLIIATPLEFLRESGRIFS